MEAWLSFRLISKHLAIHDTDIDGKHLETGLHMPWPIPFEHEASRAETRRRLAQTRRSRRSN